jgi:hypothetical protein
MTGRAQSRVLSIEPLTSAYFELALDCIIFDQRRQIARHCRLGEGKILRTEKPRTISERRRTGRMTNQLSVVWLSSVFQLSKDHQ